MEIDFNIFSINLFSMILRNSFSSIKYIQSSCFFFHTVLKTIYLSIYLYIYLSIYLSIFSIKYTPSLKLHLYMGIRIPVCIENITFLSVCHIFTHTLYTSGGPKSNGNRFLCDKPVVVQASTARCHLRRPPGISVLTGVIVGRRTAPWFTFV
ncbi:unnamed protein product [Acanthosepion pharaonis]|uniref:Uncharacterized protein n=1 Tax=Acanthosepion pharaonis TaxID=158019 RepID=A0A812AYJ0_ACAPH|nr:unnamed protein product [Sepia pharaonis]